VVLHDSGVSRHHARIFMRAGRHCVMDLGSSLGTLLNGKPLAREKEQDLRAGDRLVIGSLELLFAPLAVDDDEPTQLAPPKPTKPRTSTLITRALTDDEMRAIESGDTGKYNTLAELERAAAPPPKAAATLVELEIPTIAMKFSPEEQALVSSSPSVTLTEVEATTSTITKAASPRHADDEVPTATITKVVPPKPTGPSAADRARLRRQLQVTFFGRLVSRWREFPRRIRSIAGVVTGLVIVATLALILRTFLPAAGSGGGPRLEPSELGAELLRDSFGLGNGVVWNRPDLKEFRFQFASPTRAVAVLHYQARDISHTREVSIQLNGVDLGWVPPDSSEAEERELQLLIPISMLRRNEPNRLVFDNALNPPGIEPWRVWNMYVEVIPVPELPVAQLLAKATEEAAAARRFLEQR
jgi:pSer/pThr/pTyr-binding forkhead associated (FHA) protein